MQIELDGHVTYWSKYNPLELAMDTSEDDQEKLKAKFLGWNPEKFCIDGRWFDVIPARDLYRRSNTDGYYRVIYIQVNWETLEYYIGKANRKTWSELRRYNGSGLRFTKEFSKHKQDFQRYYIAVCSSAEETERLEASIVNEDLISSDLCLNLVAGGAGTSRHPNVVETSAKKREWMKEHPTQYKSMVEASRKAFSSGDTPQLKARSMMIKKTMSDEHYREQFRKRILDWRNENPEEYALAQEKGADAIRQPEVQLKRKATFAKWVEDHPVEYAEWQERLIEARTSPEAKEKRKESLKKWNEEHPEEAKENARIRSAAATRKTNKAVCMVDLETGDTLKEFKSQHDAARWLVEQGIAKNTNCVTSISGVCQQKPIKGHGIRKQAYGYGWRFKDN